MSQRIVSGVILFALIQVASGCTPHTVAEQYTPVIKAESAFSTGTPDEGSIRREPWYTTFNHPELDALVTQALNENLEIHQAWARLAQAELSARIAGAALYPEISAEVSATGQDRDTRTGSTALDGWSGNTAATAAVSWHIDVWGRIRANRHAALAEFEATRADMENTALVLSSSLARVYFNLQEQQALRALLERQIKTNRQFLELTVLRKTIGEGNILDVQQQQQQLLSTKAEMPEVIKQIEQQQHALAILLARSPVTYTYTPGRPLPSLPPLPPLNTPQDLLRYNPSLRAAYQRLKAADYAIAVEMAERLPGLSLTASYRLSNTSLVGGSLENMLWTITGALTQSIFDAGKRQNEAERSWMALKEKLYAFSETYLEVIGEVENALTAEKYAKDTLENLYLQQVLARESVSEAQYQYANGLTGYLNVLTALSALQTLERQMIRAHRVLLESRIALHLALGGPVEALQQPVSPAPSDSKPETS